MASKVRRRCHRIWILTALLVCLAGTFGCAPKQIFPTTYDALLIGDVPEQRAYDTDQDDRPDYCQYLNEHGRVIRLAFDYDQDGALDHQVDLDKFDPANCRQLYILLDGVSYQMIADMYDRGHFRLFHRPSRLISTFPSMTDVAFAEIFDLSPVLAYEAGYYDRPNAKLHDGSTVYLSGKNEPWNQRLDYRSRMWMDAVAYVWPKWWLDHELRAILSKYRESDKKRISGYSVASTCLGTNDGAEGYRQVLLQLEQICQAAMFASKGKIKITVFSDHGHNLTAAKFLPLKDLLKESGFRVVSKLKRPKDVVVPQFGLVTYASIETFCPAEVVQDFRVEQRARRRTKVQPSQVDRRKRNPKTKPGARYTSATYRRAIHRACDVAAVDRWGPNRLRHSCGTEVRKRFGLEAAQTVLGHATADVTQVYAERDSALAEEIMRKIG